MFSLGGGTLRGQAISSGKEGGCFFIPCTPNWTTCLKLHFHWGQCRKTTWDGPMTKDSQVLVGGTRGTGMLAVVHTSVPCAGRRDDHLPRGVPLLRKRTSQMPGHGRSSGLLSPGWT